MEAEICCRCHRFINSETGETLEGSPEILSSVDWDNIICITCTEVLREVDHDDRTVWLAG